MENYAVMSPTTGQKTRRSGIAIRGRAEQKGLFRVLLLDRFAERYRCDELHDEE